MIPRDYENEQFYSRGKAEEVRDHLQRSMSAIILAKCFANASNELANELM